MKKELCALMPMWVTALVSLAVVCLVFPPWTTAARFLYGFASVSLAAFSVGHEYVYETLPSFLTVPASRRRLLTTKLIALVPVLLTLGAAALLLLPPDPRFDRDTIAPRLSLLCAVAMAPYLTMRCRSPLAGMALAVGVAGAMQLLDGYAPWGLAAATTIGVLGGWRAFMRLEVVEVQGAHFNLLQRLHAPSRPIWLLIEKELRLQQIAFAVSAYSVVLWAGVRVTWPGLPGARDIFTAVGFIFGALVAILIGSLTSAEERQLHTHEWQLLLPTAAWQQWTVKIAVAISLALLLGLAVPTLLAGGDVGFGIWPAAAIIFLTVGSIYISSLSPGGLRALAVSAPVMLLLLLAVISWIAPVMLSVNLKWPYIVAWPFILGSTILITLTLRFGYDNHTRAGRDLTRVGWQLAVMTVIVLLVGSQYWAAQIRY